MDRRRKQARWTTPLERLEDRVVLSTAGYYTIDGTGNNLANPTWGSDGVDFLRIAPAAYVDGISSPAGADRPSARAVSNAVSDQSGQDILSDRMLSAMFYAWGQFVDHDIDQTGRSSVESLPIAVPTGDPSFDPSGTGTQTIPMSRSAYDPATGTTSPRQQVNTITAWIDGSMIYGSDATTAAALRAFAGGRLKETADGLLPTNNASTLPSGTLNMDNDAQRVSNDRLFAAGDVRANENIELTSLQTLFVREHNRIADALHKANPSLSDEQIYQEARSQVIGEIQAITYNEWLPTLLGPNALPRYTGYNPSVNPGISNEFATAAFRFGHSLLGDDVEFLGNDGKEVADTVSLADAFSNPDLIRANGIDPLLKYLASDPASEVDTKVVDNVRNFLFGLPGSGGLDLASLNIQRGRDNGLADYNTTRAALGLPRVTSFAQITSDPTLQQELQSVYGSVDKIDLWVGGLAEDHAPGASVGPTFRAILIDQFARLRDGDRLWYQNQFTGSELRQFSSTHLSEVIARNSGVTNIQSNAFVFNAGVGGVVFGDANGDGRQQSAEPGLPGVRVDLIDPTTGNVVASTKTDGRGAYRFGVAEGVRTGDYAVRVTSPTGPNGVAPSVTSHTASITRGDQFPTLSFGLLLPGGPRNRPTPTPTPGGHASPPPRTLSASPPPRVLPRSNTTPSKPATDGAASLARRLFDQVRQDLLVQAGAVLAPDQFKPFATGLNGSRRRGPTG